MKSHLTKLEQITNNLGVTLLTKLAEITQLIELEIVSIDTILEKL